MSFASLSGAKVSRLIERCSEAERLTLIVGAGASVEAALPDWSLLVRRLLARAATPKLFADDEHDLRREWVEETIEKEGLIGAAAVVEALCKESLRDWIVEAVFGPDGPGAYRPGPISQQIARLKQLYGDRLSLITTNYDDLIEEAIRDAGAEAKTYTSRPRAASANAAAVTHLHGYAGRDRVRGPFVLSEENYQSMARGASWQEDFVRVELARSLCVFVGTSLSDPNLIRYLHGDTGDERHAAIFVRQAEREALPVKVRLARERAIARRWSRRRVDVVFVDHFADVAQLLYEIGHRRQSPAEYEPVHRRARSSIRVLERQLFGMRSDKAFVSGQEIVSNKLQSTLERAAGFAGGFGAGFDSEVLAMSLWVVDPSGKRLMSWATSDRLHRLRTTLDPVPVALPSTWISVHSFCRGGVVEDDRDSPTSRWRFVRGLPLVIQHAELGRLPIGCLTVTSTQPGASTDLARMESALRGRFNELLVMGMEDFVCGALTA